MVVAIFGILFAFGGNFFISYWREHRIALQKEYLQREVRYALNFIINGKAGLDESNAANLFENYDGIFPYSTYDIWERGRRVQQGQSGNEIRFYNQDRRFRGRIFSDQRVHSTDLFFDEDEIFDNNNEHKIIPHEKSEWPIQSPYTIDLRFTGDREDASLIGIDITLVQNAQGRRLETKMHSVVKMRNFLT